MKAAFKNPDISENYRMNSILLVSYASQDQVKWGRTPSRKEHMWEILQAGIHQSPRQVVCGREGGGTVSGMAGREQFHPRENKARGGGVGTSTSVREGPDVNMAEDDTHFGVMNVNTAISPHLFWRDWSLNSELHTCKAAALPLEPHL
jgi:hypothetical protein